jgi:hypothetical protein
MCPSDERGQYPADHEGDHCGVDRDKDWGRHLMEHALL